MPTPVYKCPVPDCGEIIHQNQFVCRPHLKLVSPERKGNVEGAWRQYREARTDEQKVEHFRLHRFAVQEAVNEVVDTLKKNATKKKKR